MEKETQEDLKELLRDLIWLNGVIATELIQLVENSSASLRGSVPEKCLLQHRELRQEAVKIVARHCPHKASSLEKHVLEH
jgi:hypothetical protein